MHAVYATERLFVNEQLVPGRAAGPGNVHQTVQPPIGVGRAPGPAHLVHSSGPSGAEAGHLVHDVHTLAFAARFP
jgi:hypothetical protein